MQDDNFLGKRELNLDFDKDLKEKVKKENSDYQDNKSVQEKNDNRPLILDSECEDNFLSNKDQNLGLEINFGRERETRSREQMLLSNDQPKNKDEEHFWDPLSKLQKNQNFCIKKEDSFENACKLEIDSELSLNHNNYLKEFPDLDNSFNSGFFAESDPKFNQESKNSFFNENLPELNFSHDFGEQAAIKQEDFNDFNHSDIFQYSPVMKKPSSSTFCKQELDSSNFMNEFLEIGEGNRNSHKSTFSSHKNFNNNHNNDQNDIFAPNLRSSSSNNTKNEKNKKKKFNKNFQNNLKIQKIEDYYFREAIIKKEESKRMNRSSFQSESQLSNSTRKTGKKRGKYNMLSKSKKKEIVEFAKAHGLNQAENKFRVKKKRIIDWIDNGVERKKGAGRKTLDPKMEDKLVEWIRESVDQMNFFPAGTKIKEKALELYSKNGNFKASKGWYDKFLKRKAKEIAEIKKKANSFVNKLVYS